MKKFSFNVNDVLPQLQQVAAVVDQKNTMAILMDVVLKTYMDGDAPVLLCTTSDSDNFISMKCNLVEGEGGIELAVNAKDFVSTLRNMSGRVIILEIDEERHILKGNYDNGYFEMPFDDAGEFPQPVLGVGDKVERLIDAQLLYDMMSFTECAIGHDNLRPVINGIHIDFFTESMTAVAFDGFKMAKCTDATIKSEQEYGINIPHKACRMIMSMLQKMDGDVKVTTNGYCIVVSRSEFRIVARLYEGKYPPYNQLIMPEYPMSVTVAKEDLARVLKVVSPSTNAASEQIRFTFTDGELTLSADNLEMARTASEKIPCDYKGDKFEMAFKCSWAQSIVSNIACDNVVLKIIDHTKPALFLPEAQEDTREYVFLLMPMLILI